MKDFTTKKVIINSLIFGVVSLFFWMVISKYVLDLVFGIDDFYGVLIGLIFTLSFPFYIYIKDTHNTLKVKIKNSIISFAVLVLLIGLMFYTVLLPDAMTFTPTIHT